MEYTLYCLKCSDGTYYIGITPDLEKRVKAHNGVLRGGAKYTKGRRPVKVVYIEKLENKSEALKREYELKRLTRSQKETLFSAAK